MKEIETAESVGTVHTHTHTHTHTRSLKNWRTVGRAKNEKSLHNLNKLKMLVKISISGLLSFIILNFLMVFYRNVPISDEKSNQIMNKTTDSKYEPMELYIQGTEGYGIGRVNNDGYLNEFDYSPDMKISVLMMGSSQVEAMQVKEQESMSSILDDMLGKEKIVYNIGISGRFFLQNINTLNSAIEKYKPTDYVVIETFQLKYTEDELKVTLNDKTSETTSDSNGILSKIRNNNILRAIYGKSPFLKTIFKQIQEFKKDSKNDIDNYSVNNESILFNEELTNQLLEKIKTETSAANVKTIIFYHPNTTLDKNGQLILSNNKKEVEKFAELCEKNEICFLDMSERFKKEYEENYILPYGFNNTTIGTGHFNKYGHKMVAEELYQLIKGQGGVK